MRQARAGEPQGALPEQTQPPEIRLRPACVRDHGLQCPKGETVAKAMERYDDTSAVLMPVHSMTTSRPRQTETILVQWLDEKTRGEPARSLRHTLTATAGTGISTTCSASTGTFSPLAMRSST